MTSEPVVLIVDDDPGIRESLCNELRAAGYDAITAADGRAGLAAFRVHLPDLMITDLAMPGADGFSLITAIRAFSIPELLARIRAQLRRGSTASASVLSFDELTIDPERRRVTQGGREIKLTRTEFAVLELLAAHAGKPVFIAQIIARVWGSAPGTTHDTVRVHMSALRRKIEPDPARPRYIVTEPWIGYRFIAEPK